MKAEWKPIATMPDGEYALVSVTYNLGDEDDGHETVMWVDAWRPCEDHVNCKIWFCYPSLIHVPFTPTHWMPLPSPPEQE